MKFRAMFFLILIFSATGFAQSVEPFEVFSSIFGCGLPPHTSADYRALAAKLEAEAQRQCRRRTSFQARRLSEIQYGSPTRTGTGAGIDCLPPVKIEAKASFACFSEAPTNADVDYCIQQCGRPCTQKPVFCGSW